MRKLKYTTNDAHLMGVADAAYLTDGGDLLAALCESVVATLSTTVYVTAAGKTMHLAGWADPYHWSDEWEALGVDPDDVAGLLAAAAIDDP